MIKINNLLQIDEDLSSLLKFVYLRGSRTALGQVGFTARNIHTRRVRASITGAAGIQFIPSTFELDPGQVRTVLLSVSDVSFLENLPVGTTAVDFKISVNEILPPVIFLPEPVLPGIPPAPTIVLGCLDPNASNYNRSANINDGSCTYPPTNPPRIRGCTDRGAINFNPYASENDGTCRYRDPEAPPALPPVPVYGCTDPDATNYLPTATVNTGCTYPPRIQGCTNPSATNYNSAAEIDDGSCISAGRWILIPIAQSYKDTKTIITQTSQENFQEATQENNNTRGYYYTEYGYNEITSFGIQYEYQLEGDARAAGPRPSPPPRDISVDRQEVRKIVNRFLRPPEPEFVVCNRVGTIASETAFPAGTSRYGYKNVCRYVQIPTSTGGCTTSCVDEFIGVYGCTDPNAANYNSNATINDNTCIPKQSVACATSTELTACSNVLGSSYTGTAFRRVNIVTGGCRPLEVNENWDTSECLKITVQPPQITGCTDPRATNFNPNATVNAGCIFAPAPVTGCMDQTATNYNPNATINAGCIYAPAPVTGCTDARALNYNPSATINAGCIYAPMTVTGCTDARALNYNPNATANDGSCQYRDSGGGTGGGGGGTDETFLLEDGSILRTFGINAT